MIPWPDGYYVSPLAQLICAFVIGLVISWLSASLALVLFVTIILESIFFSCHYHTGNWLVGLRVSVIFSSIAGWIVGRSIHRLPTYVFSKRCDKKHGLKWLCRK